MRANWRIVSFHFRSLATVLLSLALCDGAVALSLGDLAMRSRVGQPFDAVIPFSAAPDDSLGAQCIRSDRDAASPNLHLPLLSNLRFEVSRSVGGGDISIRSRAIVNEPVVRLRIAVNCGPNSFLAREYVILLDPPDMGSPRLPLVLTTAPVTSAPVTGAPVAAARAAAATPARGAGIQRAATTPVPPPAGSGADTEKGGASGPRMTRSLQSTTSRASGAGRPARADGGGGPGYRLTLSRSSLEDSVEPAFPGLKRSDVLGGAGAIQRTYSDAELAGLRAEARLRLGENPIAEAAQMQVRLAALESNMSALTGQVARVEVTRRAAEDRARVLVEENRRLAARLDMAGLAAMLLAAALVLALVIWRYRVAAERRSNIARAWTAPAPQSDFDRDDADASAQHASRLVPNTSAAREAAVHEAAVHEAAMNEAAMHEGAMHEAAMHEAAMHEAAMHEAAVHQAAAPAEAPPAAVAQVEAPHTGSTRTSITNTGHLHAGVARPAVTDAAQLHQAQHFETAVYESTIVLDRPLAISPVVAVQAPQTTIDPHAASDPQMAPVRNEDADFLPATALTGVDGDRPPLSAAVLRIPTVRETSLPGPGKVQPPPNIELRLPPVSGESANGAGVDLVLDQLTASDEPTSEQARAAQYIAEFERKLFPEIALGRVALDDSRAIVGLARVYYQEDFDPGKAVSFLEYVLHRASDPMRIHLALLEILRMERRVGEYVSVARAFHGTYPDSDTHWKLVAAYGRLLDANEPTFAGDKVPGLDLDTPSNWLGSTLDMTKYVLGQKVSDSIRDLPPLAPAS